VREGVPAVVAMQYEITDTAALVFASSFYGQIAQGVSVDRAMTRAREAVKMTNDSLEWATPVLFLSSEETQIFEVQNQRLPCGVISLASRPRSLRRSTNLTCGNSGSCRLRHPVSAPFHSARGRSSWRGVHGRVTWRACTKTARSWSGTRKPRCRRGSFRHQRGNRVCCSNRICCGLRSDMSTHCESWHHT
jgi:hypothetical protein